MLWWNGVPLPTPAAPIDYNYRDIEGANSGMTLGGSYSKNIISRKEDVHVVWESLSAEEAAVISSVKNSTYGRLTYFSPKAGKFITATMYTEDLTEQLNSAQLKLGALSGDLRAELQFRQR